MQRITRVFCFFIALLVGVILTTENVSADKHQIVHREWQITHYEFWQISQDGASIEKIRVKVPSTLKIVEERTARMMLGLDLFDINGRPNVLKVVSVLAGSPGGQAGIMVDDVITAANGQPFTFGKLDWRNNAAQSTQRWRAFNYSITEKYPHDLVLTVERNDTIQDITIKREWIEAERLRRELWLEEKTPEKGPTITIRILTENFYHKNLETRAEIIQKWKKDGSVRLLWGIDSPFFGGYLHTDTGELIYVEQFVFTVWGGTKFPGVDAEYQKTLRQFDVVKNAKRPLTLTLEVLRAHTMSQGNKKEYRMLQSSVRWDIPPSIEMLMIQTSLIDIQEEGGK